MARRSTLLGRALVLCVALSSCGSGDGAEPPPSGSGPLTGTVDGRPFEERDAIWTTASAKTFSFEGSTIFLEIGTSPSMCAAEAADQAPPDQSSLAFGLASTDAQGKAQPASKAGTYVISAKPSAPEALVAQGIYQRDEACDKVSLHVVVSGTVTLTEDRVDGGALRGSFDVVLKDTGEHVTGSFSAAACPALNPNRSAHCTP